MLRCTSKTRLGKKLFICLNQLFFKYIFLLQTHTNAMIKINFRYVHQHMHFAFNMHTNMIICEQLSLTESKVFYEESLERFEFSHRSFTCFQKYCILSFDTSLKLPD